MGFGSRLRRRIKKITRKPAAFLIHPTLASQGRAIVDKKFRKKYAIASVAAVTAGVGIAAAGAGAGTAAGAAGASSAGSGAAGLSASSIGSGSLAGGGVVQKLSALAKSKVTEKANQVFERKLNTSGKELPGQVKQAAGISVGAGASSCGAYSADPVTFFQFGLTCASFYMAIILCYKIYKKVRP